MRYAVALFDCVRSQVVFPVRVKYSALFVQKLNRQWMQSKWGVLNSCKSITKSHSWPSSMLNSHVLGVLCKLKDLSECTRCFTNLVKVHLDLELLKCIIILGQFNVFLEGVSSRIIDRHLALIFGCLLCRNWSVFLFLVVLFSWVETESLALGFALLDVHSLLQLLVKRFSSILLLWVRPSLLLHRLIGLVSLRSILLYFLWSILKVGKSVLGVVILCLLHSCRRHKSWGCLPRPLGDEALVQVVGMRRVVKGLLVIVIVIDRPLVIISCGTWATHVLRRSHRRLLYGVTLLSPHFVLDTRHLVDIGRASEVSWLRSLVLLLVPRRSKLSLVLLHLIAEVSVAVVVHFEFKI